MAYKKVAQVKALPPLKRIEFKKASLAKANNQCYVLMSSLLNCWAANGQGAQQCAGFEGELKTCMETFKPPKEALSSLKYHAKRLYTKINGQND